MNIDIKFRNPEQEVFFFHKERNGLFDGGFNNGKTYVACQRAFVHLATFANYRMAIARQKYKVLKATTMASFLKFCPPKLIYQHNTQDGYTVLWNKSLIYWMHLDAYDEQDIRGLEINSALIDQAEEVEENIYLVLDARIGRWDQAIVPNYLLMGSLNLEQQREVNSIKSDDKKRECIEKYTKWPRHPDWGHFLVPNYMDTLCNPSDEDEFHWTYRRYNPASLERQKTHFYIHRESDSRLTDAASFEQMLTRDEEWVNKYVKGLTGSPKAAIHKVLPESIIEPRKVIEEFGLEFWNDFLDKIKTKAALYRILDHGETGITTCGWAAALNRVHIFYREYYVNSTLISLNRQNIADLTGNEEILGDYADPAIFKKTAQRNIPESVGMFRTVAMEYNDKDIDAPPIFWVAADNNEFATRNRLNELLQLSSRYQHPITNESPAPGIYFIRKDHEYYPYGCNEAINQTKAQRRLLIGNDNGRNIYSDERDPKIVDHAYDWVRYYVSTHSNTKAMPKRKPPKRSFAYYEYLRTKVKGYTEASNATM